MKHKFYWESLIKIPIKQYNGYITVARGTFKIVEIKLGRHFSYVEISRVASNSELEKPIYLSIVGNSWEDTCSRLAVKVMDHVSGSSKIWVNLGEISC
jgi:hypothetical protein